ncbi:MAG: hypothetical protein AAB434_08440 [Planctomycetota bacterium]
MHLGLDLDNTLIRYDQAFHAVAVEWRLVGAAFPASKQAIRAELRARPDGEREWTRLQGEVYANRMDLAELAPGAERLLQACRSRDVRVSIVSHKTVHPAIGPRVDMREVALSWMERAGLLSPTVLSRDQVWFEETRAAKAARIAALGCTHFVDDLVEVFEEPLFPPDTVRILCGRDLEPDGPSEREAYPSLDVVGDRLFGVPDAGAWDAAELRRLVEDMEQGTRAFETLYQGLNSAVLGHSLPSGALIVAKVYPRVGDDPRDRAGTEFRTSRFLWENHVWKVPKPAHADTGRQIGLYKRIAGARLRPEDVTIGDVDQAVDFLLDLQRLRPHARENRIPPASEACFSVAEHLDVLDVRLRRLLDALPPACEARTFLEESFRPCLARAVDPEGDTGSRLPEAEWILSPSDFGFHNALRGEHGILVFHDLEYFGWDDPAKLLSDALLQPDFPIPARHRTRFLGRLRAGLGLGEVFERRFRLVYPLLALKWALIVLNGFLPDRRLPRGWVPAAQLEKARREVAEAERALGLGAVPEAR